ncbi:hypothetical protein JTB14_009855 [Gonioctena quinquepunctata]|nr:hypothetical protein JTB14_009855 [Gonioctena quinquepunctata]
MCVLCKGKTSLRNLVSSKSAQWYVGEEALEKVDVCPPSFLQDLPDDLKPGTCISIRGFIKPDCSRFSVNLCCSTEPNCDIALHINPRFAQRYVVRNSRKRGYWGQEEVTSISNFNLERNTVFEIEIFIGETHYLLGIDGKHIGAFPFRIPLMKVKLLQIDGRVDVHDVGIGKCEIYPRPSSLNVPCTLKIGNSDDGDSPGELDIPFTAELPQGFPTGWEIDMKGKVKVLPEEFVVNLQKGRQVWPEPIIYLHINPRFRTVRAEQQFIKNAKLDGNWGQEERTTAFQFSPATQFSMNIRKEIDHFAIYVEGKLAGEFKFRGNVEEIDSVYIQGCITLERICLQESKRRNYFEESPILKTS